MDDLVGGGGGGGGADSHTYVLFLRPYHKTGLKLEQLLSRSLSTK